jgi:hypothetical protein
MALIVVLSLVSVPGQAVVRYTRVTVAVTATLLYTAPTIGQTGRVLIRNPSAVSVYIGDASVTVANGFEVAAGDAISINLDQGDSVYGIVAAATQVVHTISGSVVR